MRKLIVAATLLAILGFVNYSIFKKERLLKQGAVVLLELAPVDPRSLMQGDYMALNYKVRGAASRELEELGSDGRLVLALDQNSIATFKRRDNGVPLAQDEVFMRYRMRNGRLKFATNAYFFQEGRGKEFESAKYGEFRVADTGDCLLTQLRDKELRVLGVKPSAQPVTIP